MPLPIDPTGLITSGLLSKVQDLISDNIINKWRSYRTNQFLDTFLQEVSRECITQQQNQTLDEALNKLLSTPKAEDALFEAYRKVSLSASKELGPRIIALLTARLIIEDRYATEDEESIFVLAEEMRDVEFMKFCKFYNENNLEENLQKSQYTYPVSSDEMGLGSHSGSIPATHLNPIISLGKWAGKLEKVGLLYPDTVTESYRGGNFDNEKFPVIKNSFFIIFEQGVTLLHDYTRRAQGPTP